MSRSLNYRQVSGGRHGSSSYIDEIADDIFIIVASNLALQGHPSETVSGTGRNQVAEVVMSKMRSTAAAQSMQNH
jgi:hypothetical protein